VVPTPLTRAEEKRIFDRIAEKAVDEQSSPFKVGSIVRVLQGVFNGNEGKIIEADLDRNRFKVRMDLFKRETPTEFSPDQLELIEEAAPTPGPKVDAEVEERVMGELREAWEDQNQVNPFQPKQD